MKTRVQAPNRWLLPLAALLLATGPVVGCPEERIATPGEPAAEALALDPEELTALQALGYVAWDEAADPTLRGVTRHERARTSPGVNLYTNDVDEVYLVDLDGERLHTWRLPGKRNCQYAELLEEGQLMALCVAESLTLLAPDSSVIWELPLVVDHDFARLPDGSWLALHLKPARSYRGRLVVFDAIAHVAADGTLLDEDWWSAWRRLPELRRQHPPLALDRPPARPADGRVFEYYHMNTLELLRATELGKRDLRFREGNLLVCLRNASVIAVLDRDTHRVVWSWGAGILDYPHMPTLLPNGHLLVYDNGYHRGSSRVLELDPVTEAIVWSYESDPPESFFSNLRGSNQRLPNGNTLITESERGRAFEVSPEGEVVWEFWNPDVVDGRRKRIYRFLRLPTERVERFLRRAEGG
jgi:hypothetical protein